MAEKYRVQLDFTSEAFQELEALKVRVGATTRAEVVRYALRTLQWTIQQIDEGAKIFVERDGKEHEVVFQFLPDARSSATSRQEAVSAIAGNRAARVRNT